MKYSYLPNLLILTLCMTFSLNAQSPDAKSDDKKVIVIKKKVDADGQSTVEKIELIGDESEVIIDETSGDDAVFFRAEDEVRIATESVDDVDYINVYRVRKEIDEEEDLDVEVRKVDGETRVEITRNNEEPIVIEYKDDEELTAEQKQMLTEYGVEVNDDATWVVRDEDNVNRSIRISAPEGVHVIEDVEIEGPGPIAGLAQRIHMTIDKVADFDFDFDIDHPHGIVAGHNANCVALGVYVNSHGDGDLKVNRIITGSGAEDAGLLAGDILRGIDKKPVDSHRELLYALSEYEPGDIVTVDYEREGVLNTVEAEVRSWRELPEFADSWHARISCDDEPVQEVRRKVIIIKKDRDTAEELPPDVSQDPPAALNNTLDLRNFTAYPNPTDGKFRIEFEAAPKPVVVSVLDASGKEVYRDNVDNFAGYYSRQVDLTGTAQGAFILSVEQDGKYYTDQVVIH